MKRAAAPADFPRTDYKDKTATRLAYGNALLSLGRVNGSVVAVDGDVKNSTYADKFFEAFPEPRFPVLHRRAEHDRRRHGPGGQGLHPLHGHLRRLPDAGPRPDPDGRLLAFQHQDLRLPRRRQHRRGRAVADGARRPGHVPAHPGLRRALPERRRLLGGLRRGRRRSQGDVLHPDLAARDAAPLSGRRSLPRRGLQGPAERGEGRCHGRSPPGSPFTRRSRPATS